MLQKIHFFLVCVCDRGVGGGGEGAGGAGRGGALECLRYGANSPIKPTAHFINTCHNFNVTPFRIVVRPEFKCKFCFIHKSPTEKI